MSAATLAISAGIIFGGRNESPVYWINCQDNIFKTKLSFLTDQCSMSWKRLTMLMDFTRMRIMT
jgi:hypothetical protein